MNDDSMLLILHAGNAKSSSMEAIAFARDGSFDQAEERIKDAQIELNEAHLIQTSLLVKESRGVKSNPDILMVHAQNHLSAAMVQLDLTREVIHLYSTISEIKEMVMEGRK